MIPPLLYVYGKYNPRFNQPSRQSRIELAIGRAGLDQQWAGPKSGQAKILTAQPVLKTGLVGPNSLLKAKKNRGGSGRAKFGPIFFGQ